MPSDHLRQFVTAVASARIGATFNQYRETGGDDASPSAPATRCANVLRYLRERRGARVVLVAEAAGWRGARYSGLCLYSERHIHEAHTGLRRTSTHPLGWSEPSATVVQSAIAPWQHDVVLWNTVPTHPRRAAVHNSNRPPTRVELREGGALLLRLLDIVQPDHVAAIGRSAESVLGATVPAVRHPSHGGAHLCGDGLRQLLSAWLGPD